MWVMSRTCDIKSPSAPVSRPVALEAPRQNGVRVAAVITVEAAAVMLQRAELAVGNQLPRVLDERRPAIVVSDPGQDAGAARDAGDFRGLAAAAADRLFAETCFFASAAARIISKCR